MAFAYYFTLLCILFGSSSVLIDVESDSKFEIPNNQKIYARIPSRPIAGLIWAMIADENSKIKIENHYGEFKIDKENSNKGYQKFNFTCEDCELDEEYPAYFVLKRPWKENYSEVRKIIFTISAYS